MAVVISRTQRIADKPNHQQRYVSSHATDVTTPEIDRRLFSEARTRHRNDRAFFHRSVCSVCYCPPRGMKAQREATRHRDARRILIARIRISCAAQYARLAEGEPCLNLA